MREITASERTIQYEILKAWGRHPRLRIARMNTGKAFPPKSRQLVAFGVPGTGDIVGIIAPTGRMLHLECKALKGEAREAQLVMQRVIRAFGGIYEFVRSVADADAVLIPLVGPR